MKNRISKILGHFPSLYGYLSSLRSKFSRLVHLKDAKVINKSTNLLVIRDVYGEDNVIEIGENCKGKVKIKIRGERNTVIIGSDCSFGLDCSLWVEGNDSTIRIGSKTTMTRRCQINCQESGRSIVLGEDCMLANTIVVRTSDSHPIYDRETGERLNPAKDVRIGNHVWIAPDVKIMKGAVIGDGAIIGSDTTITKEVKPYEMVVGRPQKVVKTGINWSREALF